MSRDIHIHYFVPPPSNLLNFVVRQDTDNINQHIHRTNFSNLFHTLINSFSSQILILSPSTVKDSLPTCRIASDLDHDDDVHSVVSQISTYHRSDTTTSPSDNTVFGPLSSPMYLTDAILEFFQFSFKIQKIFKAETRCLIKSFIHHQLTDSKSISFPLSNLFEF